MSAADGGGAVLLLPLFADDQHGPYVRLNGNQLVTLGCGPTAFMRT